MSNKILNLDLSKDPIMPAIVYGRVGDDRLQTVTVNLSRRDEVADLTGYKITFEGTTYNGKTKVFDSENVSTTAAGLKKGTFDYTFPNMAFAVAGKYEQAYFSIVKDGKRDSTAGFEIYVDGNADIDALEAETIITEYNKLVAELNELQKQAITELNNQQNQAINEMNQNFTAAQERIVELDIQISALRDQIEQALTDFESGNFWTKEESFNKEESSANVIYQVIGKEEVLMTITLDLKNKLAGSNVENPNSVGFKSQADLANPNDIPADRYINYPSLYALDGVSNVTSNAQNKDFCNQLCFKYNVLEIVKRELGEEFFIGRGVTTLEDEIKLVTSLITQFNLNFWAKGSGVYNGSIRNWLGAKIWFDDTRWTTATRTNETNEIKKISINNDPINKIGRYFNSQGYIQGLIYADPSDGTTPTSVHADYSNLEISLKLSVNEHIKALIAQYSGKNFEPATPEEIIVGERDDVVVTPKGLKDATESTVPFKEYFGTGKQTENISGTRDASFAVGDSLGVSPNAEGKRPYTINSDGTLTLTRPAKLKITMTHKLVSGTATPSLYHYVYITDVTKLPSGFSGDDVEISSTGSTLATNGTLNYNWINSGTRVWDLPVGFVIKPSVRVQDANKAVRWIQCLGMTIEEVPTPNTKGLNISALADNPVIRLNDVTALLESERTKLGKQMVWGENHQVEDPATPNFGAVYASTDNEYKTIPATENYFTYDSKGLIVVAKDGQYKVSANVKRQWRTSVALWHYVSLMLNRGGSISKWDFSPFGGTTQNRNRQQCQAIITLKAGDTIYFTSESNNSTNALQFLNIDQFTMERLGD